MSCSCCSHMISFPPRSNITPRASRLLNSWKKAAMCGVWLNVLQRSQQLQLIPLWPWALPATVSRVWVSMRAFKSKEDFNCNHRVMESPFKTARPSLLSTMPLKMLSKENLSVSSTPFKNNTTKKRGKHMVSKLNQLPEPLICVKD